MMKTKILRVLVPVLLCLLMAASVHAKWWIFGQSEDEVSIKYLYLNEISADEANAKMTVYKEFLPDGAIILRGKASALKAKIASVRVTTDGKEKWDKAKFSEDGGFEYRFIPEIGKNYVVYIEVTNTAGKTNKVEETRREITLSDKNIRGMVQQILSQMAEAYKNEEAGRFMGYVSDDFAGDYTLLDAAIRKDFSALNNITLNFTISNIATDPKGKVFVSLNYSRMAMSASGGRALSDKGATEFVFTLGDGGIKLYAMKFPLLFGLSDAANVATGIVVSSGNEPTLVLSQTGGLVALPFDQAAKAATEGQAGIGSASMDTNPPVTFESFSFADEDKTTEVWAHNCDGNISGDFGVMGTNHHLTTKTGVLVADLGVKSIDSVTAAPGSGYIDPKSGSYGCPSSYKLFSGHVYVFQLPGGAYGIIEVTTFSGTKTFFKYKYSSSGPAF
jgi:hypothetical protein